MGVVTSDGSKDSVGTDTCSRMRRERPWMINEH